MRLPIDIETSEDRLAFELFDATTLAVGVSITLPGNAVLTFRGLRGGKDPGASGTVRLEIGIEQGASIAQAAAWLCARIKGRATAMRVGGAGVEMDPEKVERILTQHTGK